MAAATMNCPKCDQPLAKKTTSHAVFWRCEGCHGTAIGIDVLRRSFAREQINAMWQRARTADGSPAAACPSCRNQMIEVAATETPEPRIEVCRVCHFLWFDADELAGLTPLSPKQPPVERMLPPEVRQALAIAEVELVTQNAQREERRAADQFWIELARLFSTSIR